MKNKGQVGMGTYFVMLVIVVVGMALLVASSDTVGQMTNKQVVTNQSISTVSGYVNESWVNPAISYSLKDQADTWQYYDCALDAVVIRNGVGTALVADTDYTLDANSGVFSLINTASTAPSTALNLTYGDYEYCADGYNKDSGSRNIAALIILFFALAIAAAVLEKSGITNMTNFFS